jgi:RNA polymerase sigma-70 factor (ECF subfamily)
MTGAPRFVAQESPQSDALVDHLFRTRAGQMVAYLTRLFGPEHLDLAEEVVQEALLKALQNWPYSGIPQNPSGWLFRVARNAAFDAIRHRKMANQKSAGLAASELEKSDAWAALPGDTDFEEQLRDDELRMVLMCCHPALPRDACVALSLKTVGGFSTREIARALLSEEAAIGQKLVRCKRQIREQGIAFELPRGEDLAQRLDATMEVVYLMFNGGYAAHSGTDLVHQELCGEALRLAQLLATSSVGTPETHALVALMAFQAARLPARADSQGELVPLEDQDRSTWDANRVALGFRHFQLCSEGTHLSAYHLQAAIAAVHAQAKCAGDTDWAMILDLYDQLLTLAPSPIVALNRVVAVAKVRGPEQALQELQTMDEKSLRGYYLLPAVEGHLLLDVGNRESAAQCFRKALALPCSEPEKRFLQRKLTQCGNAINVSGFSGV